MEEELILSDIDLTSSLQPVEVSGDISDLNGTFNDIIDISSNDLPLLDGDDALLESIAEELFQGLSTSNPLPTDNFATALDDVGSISSPSSYSSQTGSSPRSDLTTIHLSSPGCQPSEGSDELSSPIGHDHLCHVCGNAAGKHNYYGGQVCNSCRAFFRRSVQSNSYQKFQCAKSNNCEINSKSWKSCQWCRFQKCLSSGMHIKWVLSDSERKERSKRRAANRLRKQEDISKALALKKRYPADVFTLDDEIQIKGLIGSCLDFVMEEGLKYYATNLGAWEEVLKSAFYGTSITKSTLQSLEAFSTFTASKFYRNWHEMNDLTDRDRNVLLAKNYPVIISFVNAQNIDSPLVEKYGCILKHKLNEAEEDQAMKRLLDKFNELSMHNTLVIRSYKYETMFPPNWGKEADMEAKHKELCLRVRDSTRVSKNNVDETMMFLLAFIMLFTPDSRGLKEPHKAEMAQVKYANLLSRYLKTKYKDGTAGAKFCRGMDVHAFSREIRDITDKQWS